eukprot:6210628-Pleurochrysis_carterae.AAC.2
MQVLVAARSGTSSGHRPIGWLALRAVSKRCLNAHLRSLYLAAFKMNSNGISKWHAMHNSGDSANSKQTSTLLIAPTSLAHPGKYGSHHFRKLTRYSCSYQRGFCWAPGKTASDNSSESQQSSPGHVLRVLKSRTILAHAP